MGSPKLGHTPRLVEDETLERIRRTLGNGIEGADLRDDAALVDVPGGGPVVVSVDSVVAGVHVDLALCSPADVGWKALMGALSDLGAMGARPVGALVALCVPPAGNEPEAGGHGGAEAGGELTLGVMEGVAEASRTAGCPVVGGDVSAGATLVVAVTVLGTLGNGCAVARRGASAGDVIFVTGPCGGSAAGLRVLRAGRGRAGGEATLTGEEQGLAAAYRRPQARLAEGEVARLAGAHAMIDVSDGLALDLHRLADASAVGFALHAIPVADGATEAEALGGGEDYELIVVVAPDGVDSYEARCRAAGLRPPRQIGSVTAQIGDRTWRGRPLAQLGWQHRLG